MDMPTNHAHFIKSHAWDMPMQGDHILKLHKIFSSLGPTSPNLHRWVKFGVEDFGREGQLMHTIFQPINATCHHCGMKTSKTRQTNLNIGIHAAASCQ